MHRPPLRRVLAAAAACLATTAFAQNVRGADPAVPGEILLKLATTGTLQPLVARYSLTVLNTLGARPIYRVKVPAAANVDAVIAALVAEPGVQLAEANVQQQAPEARKNIAWAIGTEVAYRTQWAPQALRLPEAQARSSGAGVRVAVLDTGVDYAHPALAGRLLPGHDFVDGDNDASEGGSPASPAWGHGTHVAGLVALAAPGAKIMPLRVLGPNGAGDVWSIAEALAYAIDPDRNPATDDGAHVINLSLGTLSRTQLFETLSQIASCNPPDVAPELDLSDPGYDDDRSRCATQRGAVLVAAAGNDGSSKVKQYPAAEGAYGLLSVAASNASRQVAAFSNSGNWIDAAAPGDGITSTVPGGGYATWSGTSMAAPLAAGVVALARALDPVSAPKDLVRHVENTTAALCGTKLRQLDAVALLNGAPAAPVRCP